MTDLETLLADRLEARADRVPVAPAPVDLMLRRAAARRRRPFVVLAAAAAVAVVAVGAAVVVPGSESGAPPPAGPSPTVTPRPVGTHQYVAEGRVRVPVPDGWGDDPRVDRCGTPRADAVVGSQVIGRDCLSERPDGVETIEVLGPGEHYDPFPTLDYAPRRIEVDGVPADISPAFCDRWTATCTVSVWVRSAGAQVVASASTREEAEVLAATVEVLPEDSLATKRVGIGHLSVEVPQTWSRDVATCGTPTEDTLLTFQFVRACLVPPVGGVESVRIVTADPLRSSGIDDVLDGVAIRREAGSCEQSIDGMCQSAIWVPSQRVGLLVTSAGDLAAVDAIMATAGIDPATAAIPAPYRLGSGLALRVDDYEQRLSDLGLVLRLPPGADVGSRPFVDGTGVAVGDVVAVGTSVRVGLASGP